MARMIAQAAALALRDGRICMVTSRSGRRWVLPKGQIEAHQSPRDAALAEAWEEAGILGRVGAEPIGAFAYEKNGIVHEVAVFLMTVTTERAEWPEKTQRLREWVPVAEALERIEEDELREIVIRLKIGNHSEPAA